MRRHRDTSPSLRLLVLFALGVLAAVGCTSHAEIELLAERPTALPDDVLQCAVDAQAEPGCLATLSYAVERTDRTSVGQILLGRAMALDGSARRALVRAALWLNNRPWVPEANIALVDDIATVEVPVFSHPTGALFFFEDAVGAEPRAGSVLADTPMTRVDLPIPDGAGPLAGDELVATLTAAAGGLAAAWQPSRSAPVRVVAATPLFNRLAGMQPAGVPGAWDAMILAGRADGLFRAGAHMDAWTQLGLALDALPADAPACASRGVLLYARYLVGIKARVDDNDEVLDELAAVCTWPQPAVELAGAEADTRDYLRELTFLTTFTRPAHAEAVTNEALRVPDQLDAWRAEVDALADRLDGRRAALLRLLAEQTAVGMSTSSGVCDVDFEARRDAEKLAIRERLAQLGRVDLANALTTDIVDADGHIDRAAVQAVVVASNQAHNRWRRAAMLVTMLQAAQQATWLATDRGVLRQACATGIEAVQAQVTTDHYDGAPGRNVERLFEIYALQRACSSATEVAGLLDTVLETAIAEGGADAVLAVLGHATGHLALSVVQPAGYDLVTVVQELTAGLGRVRSALGDAPDERLMGATLDVTIELSNMLAGTATMADVSRALTAVAQAAAPLAEAPVGDDASEVARLAPALRLVAMAGIAAISAYEGNLLAMRTQLDELEATLEKDIEVLLTNYGVEEHTDAVNRLSGAVGSLVMAFSVATPDMVELAGKDIEAALQPGPNETGWWALGLDVARVALVDVWAAMLVQEHLGDEAAAAALERASALLERTVDTGIDSFGVAGTTWELMRVLPVAHRGVAEVAALGGEIDEVLERALTQLQPPLQVALAAMTELTANPRLRAGLVDVFVVLARAAEASDLTALSKGDAAAVETFATRALGSLAPMPPEVRAYSRTFVAAILFIVDRPRASSEFELASRELEDSWLHKVAYLPRMVEAALYLRGADDLERALAIVESAIARWGDPALACDKAHVVHSLLPFVAWGHERLGEHEEAELAMERWTELLATDESFRGDGVLECTLSSQRGEFIANVNLSQTLSSLLLPRPSNEGTFQVGVGFTSLPRNEESLICGGTMLPGVRPDIIATADLAAGIWALRARDRERATRWFAGGLDAVLELTYGSQMTLGPAASTLTQAREGLGDIPLWAVAAVALDGQGWFARNLLNTGAPWVTPAGGDEEGGVDTRGGASTREPPRILEGIELGDHMAPLVDLIEATGRETVAQIEARYEGLRPLVPDDMVVELAVFYSVLIQGMQASDAQVRAPLVGLEPSDEVERAALESWLMMLDVQQGKVPSFTKIERLIDVWVAADLPVEAALFGQQAMLAASLVGDQKLVLDVATLVWERVPCEPLGAMCGVVHGKLANVWQQIGDWEKLSLAIEHALEASGRMDPMWEIQLRQTQLALMAANGRVAPLREALDTLVPMYLSMAPDDPATTNLLVLALMVDIAVDGVEGREAILAERLDVLTEKLSASGAIGAPQTKLFADLRASLDEREAARELAVRYVRWALLGEPLP